MVIRANKKELCYLLPFGFFIFSSLLTYSTIPTGRIIINIARFVLILFSLLNMCQKELTLMKLITFTVIVAFSVLIKINADYWNMLDVSLLVFGAEKIDFKKIAKVYRMVASFTIILIIVLYFLGIIKDNLYFREDGTARHSFGFIYATDLAALIFYILLSDLYIAFTEKRNMLIRYALYFLIASLVLIFCDARLGTICILMLIVCSIYITHRKGNLLKIEKFILSYSLIIFAAIILILTHLYIIFPYSPVLTIIDKTLSARLYYSKMGVIFYGYSLFGQKIEMRGAGYEDYFFIDSSYMNIILVYGIVIFAFVLYIFTKIARAKVEENELLIPVIIFLIAVNSFVGQQMFDVAYNVFLLMFLAYTNNDRFNLNRILRRLKKDGRILFQ